MSSRQLCVLVLPCANQMAWVEAISNRAEKAGWATTSEQASILTSHLVITTQAEAVLGWPGEDVLVVGSSTSAAVEASALLFNVDHWAGVRYVAAQYAHAERLKAQGANWVSADADRLDFPFGRVDNPDPTERSSGGDEGALTYLDTPQSNGLGRAVWPAALFLHEKSGKSDIDGEIFDLTGRRRVIRYGPYIEMPIGLWKVVVPFSLWIDSAIVEIRVEWASSLSVVSITEVIRQSGRYEVTLCQAWEEIGPCELRIWLDRAVFDGTIQLHDPTVIRL